MRRYRAAYILVVLVVGLGNIIANFVFPQNELLLMAISHWTLAALTFPLGIFASAIGFVLLYKGLSTPAETTLVITPIFAVLGYTQWYRLIPAFYRRQGERDLMQ
ncbi:hypothetical protein [Sinorhizobium fredii]|uniref:Uncharacterized protein n=1 Tax=Rhizobium fredii TaxID=380 RepID=A0A2L0H4K5_RHIFR|nr:hypothetical protein [Sinorhizobium fredii]AUX76398.1 hypothetical protein NXT3_CH01830 [Sinorhizobium fredii]